MEHCIDERNIRLFIEKLTELERSSLTVEKYARDVMTFRRWVGSDGHFDKSNVIRFKQVIREKYRLSSANSMLSALNKFFQLMGWEDCRIRTFKTQRASFRNEEKELSVEEYQRLLKAAKENGLNTCCETTGFAKEEVFAEVIENLDTILFDVKHWDSQKHKEGTAVPNELILSNLKYAIETGKDVLPRIPVIPGFNDPLNDAKNLARVIKEAGGTKCQLLPFHQFGENKYDQLGREYAYKDVSAYHRKDLENYRRVFIDNDITAFF